MSATGDTVGHGEAPNVSKTRAAEQKATAGILQDVNSIADSEHPQQQTQQLQQHLQTQQQQPQPQPQQQQQCSFFIDVGTDKDAARFHYENSVQFVVAEARLAKRFSMVPAHHRGDAQIFEDVGNLCPTQTPRAGASCGDDAMSVNSKSDLYSFLVSQALYCEACSSLSFGYSPKGSAVPQSDDKKRLLTRSLLTKLKNERSDEILQRLCKHLVNNVASCEDIVALLRHRCLKPPLDYLGKLLAHNHPLLINVLRIYLGGYGTDIFCSSSREQSKALRIVEAFTGSPELGGFDYDCSEGGLLIDAVMSPYSRAAWAVISNPHTAWSKHSARDIATLIDEDNVPYATKNGLLDVPSVKEQLEKLRRYRGWCVD